MKKKILAGLLALCMVVTMLPLTAFAGDDEPPTPGVATLEADGFSGVPSTYAYTGAVPDLGTAVTYSKAHTVKADAEAQEENAETITQTIEIAGEDITLSYMVEPPADPEVTALTEPEPVEATAENCVVGAKVHVFATVSAKTSEAEVKAKDAVTDADGKVTTSAVEAKEAVVGYAAPESPIDIGTMEITEGVRELTISIDAGPTLTAGADAAAVTLTVVDNASGEVDYDAEAYEIESSNTAIATVENASGTLKVTPVKAGGPVTITVSAPATANYGAKTATYNVLVEAGTQAISVTGHTDNALTINATDTNPTKELTVANAKDRTVSAVSADPTSVGVEVNADNNKVTVTGLKATTAPVKVTIKALKSDKYAESDAVEVNVTVTETAAVTINGFDTTAKTVAFGSSTINAKEGVTASYADPAGNITTLTADKIKFKSSAEAVATVVEATGVVAIVAPGTTTITAFVEASAEPEYAAAEVSFELTVTAQAVAQDDVVIVLADTSKAYTGDPLTTTVTSITPTGDGQGPIAASNYEIDGYANNTNVGTATVTIKFKGNYSGTVTATFEITPGGARTLTGAATVNPSSGTASVDLSNITNMPADGKIKSGTCTANDFVKVSGGKGTTSLELTFNNDTMDVIPASTAFTIVIESENVADSTLTLTVTYTNLEIPTITAPASGSVTLKVLAGFVAADGTTECTTTQAQLDEMSAEDIATAVAENGDHYNHKCLVTGYTKAEESTITDEFKKVTVTIASDGTLGTHTAPAGSNLTVNGDASDTEAKTLSFDISTASTTVAGTYTMSITITESGVQGHEYAGTTLYLPITVEEVPLVAPAGTVTPDPTVPDDGDEEDPGENSGTDDPGTDVPDPVEVADPVSTDENGQVTLPDKEEGVAQPVVNEEAGVAATVPADVTGKVEATIAMETVTIGDEEVDVVTVEIKVDGEVPEMDIDTAINVTEEALADVEDKDMLVAYVIDENGNKTVMPKSVLSEDGIMSTSVPNGSKVVLGKAESVLTGLDETYEEAAKAMDYLSARGVMQGKDNNAAEPKATTNRYELVMMLHNLERNAEKGEAGDFGDVAEGHWAGNAVAWAFEMGIAKGDGTNFNGEKDMTREELAVFLYRYAQKYAPNTLGNADKSEYVDGDKLSGWAEEAMRWAVGNGIINGDGNGSVMPSATATREQVAMMMTRLLKAM